MDEDGSRLKTLENGKKKMAAVRMAKWLRTFSEERGKALRLRTESHRLMKRRTCLSVPRYQKEAPNPNYTP